MKKTIALLLAATGMAFGDNVTDKLIWDDDKTVADLSQVDYSAKEFTVALTLDLNMMTSVDAAIFYVTGKNADESVKTTPSHGLGYDSYDMDICGWYNGGYDNKLSVLDLMVASNGASYATVIYTFKTKIEGEFYQCIFDKEIAFWTVDGEQIGDTKYKAATRTGSTLGTLTSLTLQSSYVSDLYFYNEALKKDDVSKLSALEQLKKGFTGSGGTDTPTTPESPAAPEPTTATLSLLALAGLAARRRRK